MAIKKTHQKLLFYISDHRVPGGESVGTKGGQTFIWKFDPKGIFTSSATVKSKIKDAMVNQLSYLNQSNILDLTAKKKYFGFPQL